jgi:hypothetical protein
MVITRWRETSSRRSVKMVSYGNRRRKLSGKPKSGSKKGPF